MQNIVAEASQITEFFGPYKGIAITILTIATVLIVYILATKALRKFLLKRAQKIENVNNFLFYWRISWMVVGAIFIVVSLSGSLAALGISAAFLGMILGWSLQAPVTGIAAWLMIVIRRPFKIGDRIIVSGITGDVVDITLTHVVINQVGGTIGGEEKSGRGVLIPTAILFQQIIYNYTFETKYLLDEVTVTITYESDLEEAEKILIDSATLITKDIIEDCGQQPFTRVEIADNGIRIRLRYQTLATDRARIASEISKNIIRKFNENPKVEFCYPHLEVLHRPKGG